MSAASEGQRFGTIALGVANLVGVVVLGRLLADPQVRASPLHLVSLTVLPFSGWPGLVQVADHYDILQVQYSLARSSLAFVGGSLPLLQVWLSYAAVAPPYNSICPLSMASRLSATTRAHS